MSHWSKHPKELWILGLTELCERFAFWGIGNLLVLYLLEYYHYSRENATHIYGIFTGCAAFLPFVGGFLADRWNYQAPLLIGALVNALGCFLIATGIHSLLYVSLVIIALGFGIFTPSIVALLGHAYRDMPSKREAGFSIYYASINVGVFLALASLGTIAKVINWNVAFFIAGIVQLLGLIPLGLYLSKHNKISHSFKKNHGSYKEPLSKREKDRILVIIVFCLVSIFFWIAYNQAFSSMGIFAHSYMGKKIGSLEIPEGVFFSTESFFLILLAPVLAFSYGWLQKKSLDPTPATKTVFSLFFISACFLVMTIASIQIPDHATSANVAWGYLVFSYFLMAVGEMLLAPIGLSIISHLAPSRFAAFFVGIWYVCVGAAFYSGGLLAGLMDKMGGLSHFFAIFVAITLIPCILLFFVRKKLTQLAHRDLSHEVDSTPK